MRLLLNLLWFFLGGWLSGLLWILAGVIFAITIIGLPFVPAIFRMASFAAWPFGRIAVDREAGPVSFLLNVVWFIFAGWWLALHHILLAIPLAVSIIGIPFAWQHVKFAGLALTPVGKAIAEV